MIKLVPIELSYQTIAKNRFEKKTNAFPFCYADDFVIASNL